MADYAHKLLSVAEMKRALKQTAATEPDLDQMHDALDAASEEIQEYLERVIIQDAWTEYHQLSATEPSILRVKHWPISSITEIAEDSDRDYGSATLLTANTDYVVMDKGEHTAELVRLSGDSPTSWESGFEAIRIKLTGGWLLADVPRPIRRVCREYLARQFHAAVDQEYAYSRVSDARGDVTYFAQVKLTTAQYSTLSNYRDHGASTCVRFETT
jgi:hypothetical protein